MVKTRNGLFSNAGYGGGTFNLNNAFGEYESAPRGISGLGNIPASVKKIPEHCDDSTAYKKCFDVAWSEAQLKCDYCRENPKDSICEGYEDSPDNMLCLRKVATTMSRDNCVPSYCATADPNQADFSFDPFKPGDGCGTPNTIKNVQHQVGTKPDGFWGPLSQEAYETNKRVFGTNWCDMVTGCTGLSPIGSEGCDGKPINVGPPTTPTAPAEEPLTPAPQEQKTMSLLVGAGLLAAAMGGVWLYSSKKGKR